MEAQPNKKCLSDDTAYKSTHFDTIDRSLLPPGTQTVPVLKKPDTSRQVEYNCEKFNSNGLDQYYQEILNCSKNNASKTCPGLLCNNQKEITENNNVYNRNVPVNPQLVELDMRPSGHTCYNYRNFDGPRDLQFSEGVAPVTRLVTGKGDYLGYAQNVNIETDLLNINRKTNNVPCHKYVTPCNDCVQPCNVDAPFCATNGKDDRFYNYQNAITDNTKPENLHFSNLLDGDNFNKKCNYNQENQDCDNFMALTGKCSMGAACGNSNETPYYSHAGISKPYYIRKDKTPLVVGPIRKDQQCESTWNNVTRRRISTKLSNLKKF